MSHTETMLGKRVSWLSVLSLCLSSFPMTCPLGVVLGFVAKDEISHNQDLRGNGLALSSIVIGCLSIIIVVISIGVFVKDVSNWRTDCSVYRGLLTNPLADYETKKMVARDLKNPPKLFGFIDVIAHE